MVADSQVGDTQPASGAERQPSGAVGDALPYMQLLADPERATPEQIEDDPINNINICLLFCLVVIMNARLGGGMSITRQGGTQ